MLRSTLSLLSISGLLVSFADSAKTGSITWLSPTNGDVYKSGDTIVGRWTSDDEVPSPSFRLCVNSIKRRSNHHSKEDGDNEDDDSETGGSRGDDGDESCGGDVWPTISQSDSDGSYLIHMALPNVTTAVPQCYLEMVDDNGEKSSSPTFSFGPSGADSGVGDSDGKASADTADQADSANDTPAAPATSSIASSSPDAAVQSSSSSSTPVSPQDASAQSSSPAPSPTASMSNANLQTTTSQTPSSLAETRMPAPTAAYAVPLSLVLSVLLAAGGLSLHQRRKLRAERQLEHDALKTRATLSRHSTLSFAGFMALGRGPSTHSRATSVSMMRAWRRDVSRFGHDHDQSGSTLTPADDDTYVAKTDDARSVLSTSSRGSAPSKRAPRPQTREPFYTGNGSNGHSSSRNHGSTVPAGLFRAGLSPRVPHPHDEDNWDKPKHPTKRPPSAGEGEGEGDVNASVNDEVMSRYFEFSPIPLSPPAPRAHGRDPSPVSVPERLHVRRYADSANAEYDRSLPPRVPEKDLYDVVARRLTRK